MVASIAAGTTAQYYVSRTEYYLGGDEPRGTWIADGGFGLPIGQAVDGVRFEQLHAALDAAGQTLLTNDGNRLGQVGGYDLTFSAPKSMSVLWGIGDATLRSQLEAVQRDAVQAAIGMLEQNAAFCRRGKGGQQLEKVSLTVAAFQHGEARPALHTDGTTFADCALHTHAVVLNLGVRDDGSVGRLDGRPLFAFKMSAGSWYHHACAQGLRRLGLGIEITGTNGIFEIAGVDADLCQFFSARRQEIVAELSELGLESSDAPALAAAKALTTRRSKQELKEGDRHEFWRKKAESLGYSPSLIVEQARAQAQTRLSQEVGAADALRQSVLDQLTEKASTFERRQLLAALAAHLTGAPGDINLEEVLAGLANDNHIIELDHDRWGHAIYSTPEVIELESGLHARATRLAAAAVQSPDPEQVNALIDACSLNTEQAAAARIACDSKSIVIIEGGPGVGKTTLLQPVTEAWQQRGWRVIGASTAWKIANQLHQDLGVEARAIDSWLARAEHDREVLTDKTVLLVDEAGLLTSRQMDRLLTEVERAQQAGQQIAVRMVGDRRQLQPIGGPGLRIVADAIGVQRVDTIVRQRQEWARNAVTAFGGGDAPAALSAFDEHGYLHQCDGEHDSIARLTQGWDQYCDTHGDGTALMIAKSNRQVIALNAAARALLQSRGRIEAGAGTAFEAVTPSGQTHRLDLAKGDVVRFLHRNDELGVINGSTGTVIDFHSSGPDQTTIVVRTNGRKISFSAEQIADEKGRIQLTHAYATTCYGAQGLTTEQAFVLVDPSMDRHDIFVAASRAREATHLFVDRKGLDGRVKAARLLNDRDRQVEEDERFGVLSAALGRVGTKASTLDYLRPLEHSPEHARERSAVHEQSKRVSERDRQRSVGGLSHEL